MHLCFIDENVAFFTSNELSDQWGDDWNDAPFEHNAGYPYENGAIIIRIEYSAPIEYQTPENGQLNSHYSVQEINKGVVPWLQHNNGGKNIFAGASIDEFISEILASGGTIGKVSKGLPN